MLERIIGILKLDVNTYEEVEHDKGATTQAAIVVAITAVLIGIGGALDSSSTSVAGGFISGLVSGFIMWVVWAAVTFFIGTKLFGGKADMGEMLRVLGFARAPSALRALIFIPVIGRILSIVALFWSLACGFIAVRQGLDLDNTKAALTIVLGLIPALILSGLMGAVVGLIGL